MADRATGATPEEGPSWAPQRAAAARNEARILDAARALLSHRDAAGVDMRELAAAAGVGVGTLYRRFGDKRGLLAAVVGEHEAALQEQILRGPPPLGPGAPPPVRVDAFLAALAALTERNLDVLLATDATPPGRLGIGAYTAWRTHLAHLLGEARPDLARADAGWSADLLLAALDPVLYAEQRRRHRISAERIGRNLRRLAERLVSPSSHGAGDHRT